MFAAITLISIVVLAVLLYCVVAGIHRRNQIGMTLQQELRDTRLLQEISAQLISPDSSRSLYEKIVDAAQTIMDSDFASMQMLHPDRGKEGELHLLTFRGFNPEAAVFWEWVGAESAGTCSAALRRQGRVIVSDVEACDFMTGTDDLATFRDTGIRSCQSTPLVSRSGNIVGMISTHWRTAHEPSERDLRLFDILVRQAADLIERDQAAEAEAQARRAAEEANRAKDEFLAMLSHELRNPLTVILGWTRILQSGQIPLERAAHAIDIMERNAKVEAQLVDSLLDLSRIASGKLSLDVESVDLLFTVQSAVDSLRPAAQDKGITLTAEAPFEPVFVTGDSGRLQQIFSNIIANAIKFTPRGGQVHVQMSRGESEARIEVIDDGEGISKDFLPHVFDRFRQAARGNARPHGGLGLGLAIVRELVHAHGGNVTAASPGKGLGSTFTVTLPLLTDPAGVSEQTDRVHPAEVDS